MCICRGKEKKKLIASCKKKDIHAICECAENVLVGNVPLTPQQKKRLKKHKKALIKLANTNIDWKKKKRFIQQKGSGLLTTLLGVAVPALISLFTR
jgi:hypothetical protein